MVRRDDRGRGALSFAVPSGSFFGLVGPIGAGETTALSMAVGLLRPDAGTARIFGHDVWTDPVRAKAITGLTIRSISSTPAGTRAGPSTSRRRWSGWRASSSMPPVTRVRVVSVPAVRRSLQ